MQDGTKGKNASWWKNWLSTAHPLVAKKQILMIFAAMFMAPVDADPGSQLVLAYVVNRHGTRNLLPKLSSALKDAPTAVSSTGAASLFAQPFGGGPLCMSFTLRI